MSSRKYRSPEEQARRAKIRELLQESNISSMAATVRTDWTMLRLTAPSEMELMPASSPLDRLKEQVMEAIMYSN